MDAAYRARMVPSSLHGRTQHKTMQARLSEDIVRHSEHSLFFRTAPGQFCLTEFLTDVTIPEEFRQPILARRRFRSLERGPALALDIQDLMRVDALDHAIEPDAIFSLFKENKARYADPRAANAGVAFIRSFVCVYRNAEVLAYRVGRYRDDRDNFLARQSIGFSTLVSVDEVDLFSMHDFGIVKCGVRATQVDLDMPRIPNEGEFDGVDASLARFIWVTQPSGENDLLAVILLRCPDWFEPIRRRLAINDLHWLDITTKFNDFDDFDPWSQQVLQAIRTGRTAIEQGIAS